MASATRIRIGATVQAISMPVWWVVRDGVGLALALNRTITVINSPSTNSVIGMTIQKVKSEKDRMCS